MLRMYASNSHSYTHLILALGIVREPTVWVFITSQYRGIMTWPACEGVTRGGALVSGAHGGARGQSLRARRGGAGGHQAYQQVHAQALLPLAALRYDHVPRVLLQAWPCQGTRARQSMSRQANDMCARII